MQNENFIEMDLNVKRQLIFLNFNIDLYDRPLTIGPKTFDVYDRRSTCVIWIDNDFEHLDSVSKLRHEKKIFVHIGNVTDVNRTLPLDFDIFFIDKGNFIISLISIYYIVYTLQLCPTQFSGIDPNNFSSKYYIFALKSFVIFHIFMI